MEQPKLDASYLKFLLNNSSASDIVNYLRKVIPIKIAAKEKIVSKHGVALWSHTDRHDYLFTGSMNHFTELRDIVARLTPLGTYVRTVVDLGSGLGCLPMYQYFAPRVSFNSVHLDFVGYEIDSDKVKFAKELISQLKEAHYIPPKDKTVFHQQDLSDEAFKFPKNLKGAIFYGWDSLNYETGKIVLKKIYDLGGMVIWRPASGEGTRAINDTMLFEKINLNSHIVLTPKKRIPKSMKPKIKLAV